ncbi:MULTISPECIES: tetratricopeptide repeat protein [unclassified Microbulbifer]|uniref:tetratricopeptide repeat protein n=1 Tax=unclassified Microbulbifer TaxID=2619833 RepID=UPI0027E56D0E|nr:MULTISPECIES: tetratricopeptide repeat protein [unclassified Microbulbifer]
MDILDGQIQRLIERAGQQYRYGDFRGGMESLREALSIDPQQYFPHSFLAVGLLNMKRLVAAEHEARIGVQLEPEAHFAHFALGEVLQAQLKFKQALKHQEQALALSPTDADYHRAVAETLALMGRDKAAKAYLDKALQLDPESADTLAQLGEWHLGRNEKEEAARFFDEALNLEPQHRAALTGKGRLLLYRGKTDEAYDHAIWVLQQDADNYGALQLLASIKIRRNPVFGLWFRMNAWLTAGGNMRTILLLIGAYVLFQLASQLLQDRGLSEAATLLRYTWLGVVIYSWVGPAWFRSKLEEELKSVRLKPGF